MKCIQVRKFSLSHTHTHTHVGFYGLRGLSIGVMVFILYKLYVLLPYTYPTPKLSPHRRRCISIFPQKNSLCMIYKRFKLWGHWKCPHKSPSPCNTYVIIQICVLINHISMPTHTLYKLNYIQSWPKISAPLVNMIKEGCEILSAL